MQTFKVEPIFTNNQFSFKIQISDTAWENLTVGTSSVSVKYAFADKKANADNIVTFIPINSSNVTVEFANSTFTITCTNVTLFDNLLDYLHLSIILVADSNFIFQNAEFYDNLTFASVNYKLLNVNQLQNIIDNVVVSNLSTFINPDNKTYKSTTISLNAMKIESGLPNYYFTTNAVALSDLVDTSVFTIETSDIMSIVGYTITYLNNMNELVTKYYSFDEEVLAYKQNQLLSYKDVTTTNFSAEHTYVTKNYFTEIVVNNKQMTVTNGQNVLLQIHVNALNYIVEILEVFERYGYLQIVAKTKSTLSDVTSAITIFTIDFVTSTYYENIVTSIVDANIKHLIIKDEDSHLAVYAFETNVINVFKMIFDISAKTFYSNYQAIAISGFNNVSVNVFDAVMYNDNCLVAANYNNSFYIFVFNGSTTKEYNFNEAYKFAKFSKNKKHLYGLNASNSLVDINVLTLLQNDENNTLSSTILTKQYAPKIFSDTELVNFQLLDQYISICDFHNSTFILVPYNDISSWSVPYIESTKLLRFSSEVGSTVNAFKSKYNNQFLNTFTSNKLNILEVISTPYIDLKTESDQLISIINDNEIYIQKAIQNVASKQIHEIDLIENSSTVYATNFIKLSSFGLATVDPANLDIHENAKLDMYIKFEDDVQIIPNFTRFLDDAGITIPEKVNVTANSIVSSTIIATKDCEIYSIDDANITVNDSAPVKRANVLSGDSITFYVNAANTSSTEKLSRFLVNSKIVTWSVTTAQSSTIYKIEGHVQSDEALSLDNTTVICIDKTTNQQVSTYTTSTDGYFIFNNLVNNRDYLIVGYKNYDSSTKHRILSKTIKAS